MKKVSKDKSKAGRADIARSPKPPRSGKAGAVKAPSRKGPAGAARAAGRTAKAQTAPTQPNAAASDPVKLRWMVGSPPPPDRVVRWVDASWYKFPQSRWAFSHVREVMPTRNVPRGAGATVPLPRAERDDIDAVRFQVLGSEKSMTWGESLPANYTDGIVVLHKGRIVYERYFGALKADGQHIAFSVTKSLVGTLGAMMVAEGTLDPDALVIKYIPELKGSGFGDATVRQVLDMTTGIKFSEKYADPKAEIWQHAFAGNMLAPPPGWKGPKSFTEFMPTVKKQGQHDEAFGYRSVNTDVLGWLIARVSGQPVGDNLAQRFWSKLGAEQDGYILLDSVGTDFAGAGFNAGLRDLARFGQMMLQDGRFNKQQIVPKAVVDDIRRGADQGHFAKSAYAFYPGWSYRNQWWVTHNEHGAYTAIGVHGQLCYIDPKAKMVIARFASHPHADSDSRDSTSLPAYHALAKHLIAHPR